MRPHRLIGHTLFVVLACWPSLLRAQTTLSDPIKDQLVGSWILVSVTTHVGTKVFSQGHPMPTINVKDVQPYGPNPKGTLTLERNGRFASTILYFDASKSPAADSERPKEFEASSGTYSMHPSQSKIIILSFEASGSRSERYVHIKTLTANELQFSTLSPPGGATFSSLFYRRAQ